MIHSWVKDIEINIAEYLYSLNKKENPYSYYPSKKDFTSNGANLSLGFSCFAIKILYTLNLWDKLDANKKDSWGEYINSFQKSKKGIPANSFVDDEIYNFYNNPDLKNLLKDKLKLLINLTNENKFKTHSQLFEEAIRAETKQAISTLNQIGYSNVSKYSDFPFKKNDIFDFLYSLNWSKPWSAGGQFAALSVFSKTQLKEDQYANTFNSLSEFLNEIIDNETGLYYLNSFENRSEVINGTMKVITGLDWINHEIHYPEKLIDFCLNTKPTNTGCDLVDIVYVLYKCLGQVEYKRNEIVKYMEEVLNLIYLHYKEDEGGFSYSIDKSQEYYYGLRITKGSNQADIHGTILLTWALSMIFFIQENEDFNWKILKP